MREEFVINRQGRRYVLYAGLLAEAHERFAEFSIDTELLYLEPVPIVRAKFKGRKRPEEIILEEYTENVETTGIGTGARKDDKEGKPGKNAPIEMAETRAKARALRDAINVGMTALEELGGEDEEPAPPQRRQAAPQPVAEDTELASQDQENSEDGVHIDERQIKALRTLVPKARPKMSATEAIAAFEDAQGHPIELMSHDKAAAWIVKLQEGINKQAKAKPRSASG
jgi:hypothetical protein